MRLPNFRDAYIPQAKIEDYLLSPAHPAGRGKAQFFTHFGFSREAWEVLAAALLRHVAENDVAKVEESPFGQRYVIDGMLTAPDGREPLVRSVWFIETGTDTPRFVTAYPLEDAGGTR